MAPLGYRWVTIEEGPNRHSLVTDIGSDKDEDVATECYQIPTQFDIFLYSNICLHFYVNMFIWLC